MRMRDLLARAREELRYEPIEKRVRATAGDETIVDTTRALLLWEPRRICPIYAMPAEDIRAELAPAPASDAEVPGLLHPGIPFGVHTAPGEPVSLAGAAGYRLDDLPGYVAVDFEAFDWREEDEPVRGHPRDPFHRVDVCRSSRPLRIERDGELVAETTSARLVFETGLPVRFYVPREDIHVPLRPSELRTYCPYKGEASYWSFEGGEDLIWCYEQPLADSAARRAARASGTSASRCYLDGVRHEPREDEIVEVMLDEFGV